MIVRRYRMTFKTVPFFLCSKKSSMVKQRLDDDWTAELRQTSRF